MISPKKILTEIGITLFGILLMLIAGFLIFVIPYLMISYFKIDDNFYPHFVAVWLIIIAGTHRCHLIGQSAIKYLKGDENS